MTAPTTTGAAQQYLAEVEVALADLPAEDRAELLDDLAMHLSAVEAEDDGRTLAARLGSSSDYAAELRSSAGLPARGDLRRSSRASARARLRQRWDVLNEHRWVREVLDFLSALRPAWWALRGYLVVLIPTLRPVNGTRDFPVPSVFGSHIVGLALVLAAVVASVALGRRQLPRGAAAAVVAANIVLALLALGLADDARSRLSYRGAAVTTASLTAPEAFPLTSVHGPVTNIFPYAEDGTPLTGVLLFDQDGRPLRSSEQRWWSDACPRVIAAPLAADGVAVPFSYPHAYVAEREGGAPPCTAALTPAVPLPVFGPTATPAASPSPAASPRG